MRKTATHPPSMRRPGARLLVVAFLLGVLVACGSADDDAPSAPEPTAASPSSAATTAPPTPAPTAPATPAPASAIPDIPVRSASLADLATETVVAPVSLSMPRLGIEVPIDPVGVAPDGQMEIPPLAERAGWYRFGATAGQATGTAVIAAHVDSIASAGVGPFAQLQDTAAGDAVDVVLQDGSTVRYVVTTIERTAKPAVSWPEIFRKDGDARLILITCGGTFERAARSYSDNVIVTAVPDGAQ